MTSTASDLSIYHEPPRMDDSIRLIVASEERNHLMSWFRLDPI